jgi:hypothetical protein
VTLILGLNTDRGKAGPINPVQGCGDPLPMKLTKALNHQLLAPISEFHAE